MAEKDKKVIVYTSGMSGTTAVSKQQEKIISQLSALKISFETVDVCELDKDAKDKLKEIMGNPLPRMPQICYGDCLCGGYEEFEYAIEGGIGEVQEFLHKK